MKCLQSICPVVLLLSVLVGCGRKATPEYVFPNPDPKPDAEKPEPTAAKPCFIWIDAAANFSDFADSRDNIARDLKKVSDCGFTAVVVDVRPTTGDLLYKSTHCVQETCLYAWVNGVYQPVKRTAGWDYLQAFIDEGHKLGLKVYAGFNTFVGGNQSGIVFRDAHFKSLATMMNTSTAIRSIMDIGTENTKFLNPVHEEVQQYVITLLKDLAAYKGLDGIILDRGRFQGYQSDFSDYTRKKFEAYIGKQVVNWPGDVLPRGWKDGVPSPVPAHYLKWNEFRAKTIHDFMTAARTAVKAVRKDIGFGAYVGGWYSSYYPNGVNWASPRYNTGATFSSWATPKYKEFGFADQMDVLIIGAYASPGAVFGVSEWTMQGFCSLAAKRVMGDAGLLVGGPDVGNWDYENRFTQEQENQAIVQSVKACGDRCGGYFLFDMIHLKHADQWKYAKEGIALFNRKP